MDNAKAKSVYDSLPGLDAPITLSDIQRAKAVLARAEAALGVAQAVKKEAPIPLHPQSLEDPAQGDKTPAVVEWYRDNAPEEYRRRYAGRKTHLEDRRKERPRWVAPMPRNCAENAVPDQKSGVPLLYQGAIKNAEERLEASAEITRAEIIQILGRYARENPDEYSHEVRLKGRALLKKLTHGSSNKNKRRHVEAALRAILPRATGRLPERREQHTRSLHVCGGSWKRLPGRTDSKSPMKRAIVCWLRRHSR